MGHHIVPPPGLFVSLGSGMCFCCLCISCKGRMSCLCLLCQPCWGRGVGCGGCQHPWVPPSWPQSWVVPGTPVLLQCCPDARSSICLRDLIFLSLSLFFLPLHCSCSLLSPSSSLHLLCALSLSLSLSFPLVHGGKGIRFTLSEEIYPEKGTCAARPPRTCLLPPAWASNSPGTAGQGGQEPCPSTPGLGDPWWGQSWSSLPTDSHSQGCFGLNWEELCSAILITPETGAEVHAPWK